MGEQSVPHRNSNQAGNNGNQQQNNETNGDHEMENGALETNGDVLNEEGLEEDFDEEEDISPEEFVRLDNQLDALFSALDEIETKNDSIHAQLLQLLQANREIRKQLQEQSDTNNDDGATASAPQQ